MCSMCIHVSKNVIVDVSDLRCMFQDSLPVHVHV